jgi:putative ABC transport system permease protein
MIVRVNGDAEEMALSVRSLVKQTLSGLATLSVEPVARSFEFEMRPWRLGSIMFGLLAGITLLLAAVGLFGSVAFTVVQRTPEIGIRSALGAPRSHVTRVVLADALRAVAIGLSSGLVAAYFASELVGALLFETSARDPWSYAAALLAVVAASIVAATIPVRRATRIDPVSALRSE